MLMLLLELISHPFPAYAASTTAAPGIDRRATGLTFQFRAMTRNSGLFDLPLALTVSVVKGSQRG